MIKFGMVALLYMVSTVLYYLAPPMAMYFALCLASGWIGVDIGKQLEDVR